MNINTMLRIAEKMDQMMNPRTRNWKPNEKRECLNCGKLHSHNNSFCSPKCCKEYKDK